MAKGKESMKTTSNGHGHVMANEREEGLLRENSGYKEEEERERKGERKREGKRKE